MQRTGWFALLLLALLAVACQAAEESTDEESADTALSATAPTTTWQCRNDLEISCNAGRCETADSFTPMDVQVDDAGSMSVCAYSGCWEGTGTAVKNDAFVVLVGHDLPFSTAPDSADIVIALDRTDLVAILKAGAFAHPLVCEKQ